jgi:hypothetical protein
VGSEDRPEATLGDNRSGRRGRKSVSPAVRDRSGSHRDERIALPLPESPS